MAAKDAISGKFASCYITINGERFNFMSMTDFESTWTPEIVDVPILGQAAVGHKAVGGSGSWSGTAYYNNSVFREMADKYQKTGVMDYFEMQVTNEDPTSTIGRQTTILHNCLCDSFPLAKFTSGADVLTEELSGTFGSFDLPEKFSLLAGMK
jgi:hypothetical protein